MFLQMENNINYIQVASDLAAAKGNDPDNTELHETLRKKLFTFNRALSPEEQEIYNCINDGYVSEKGYVG